MLEQNKRRSNRVRNLITICALTAVVISVSTYAWFVGMRTVNVAPFEVEIASTESLLLSLDGVGWSPTVSISQENYKTGSYEGNTNNWGGDGLFPVSSIGEMDIAASRMKLFEKASFTPTPGGFRVMVSRVNNYQTVEDVLEPERDGYVVFDLFIKNFTGTQYIKELNVLDEEAIYLTNDSSVKVSLDGGVPGTGIENSVRVAFAQIGRVIGTSNDETVITGISCSDTEDVTGICRTAQIWEPNDTDHVANAISWYETSCLARTGLDVRSEASYSGTCGRVIDGLAYPTYATKAAIDSTDNVNIYDGPAYNKYEVPEQEESLLVPYSYFTDTMKLLTGTVRPPFMTLAPNSITKVRIYIYIEGQDIDNYDFASIGKKISIKFGFTKERFTEDDIKYSGPDLNKGFGPNGEDLTPPVITLLGENPMPVSLNDEFADPGATASDNKDGVIEVENIIATGTVNTSVPGTYKITYTAIDAAGNVGTKTRTVIVQEE